MEIELYNVRYKNILEKFSYKFEKGKVTSILGKSGSGKSLIGYIIMDLVKFDSGNILVNGKTSFNLNQFMKDVGYVFQKPTEHFFCKTVSEEIGFGLKQFKFKMHKMEEQIRESLLMVGLDDSFYYKDINTLSSGEAFLVALASSLVLNPKVIILDEPTVYLDNKYRTILVKLIKMLRDRYNKTVIVMSNDISFVYDISDNYMFMDNCKLIKSGSINDLINNSDLLSSFGYEIPMTISFIKMVNKRKGIELNYTNDIDKLVEEVIDNVG